MWLSKIGKEEKPIKEFIIEVVAGAPGAQFCQNLQECIPELSMRKTGAYSIYPQPPTNHCGRLPLNFLALWVTLGCSLSTLLTVQRRPWDRIHSILQDDMGMQMESVPAQNGLLWQQQKSRADQGDMTSAPEASATLT